MAHLRKKGDYYYADFYDPDRKPQRKWVPLKTKDKSVARIALVNLEKRAIVDGYDPWRDSIAGTTTLNGAVSQFLSSRSHCEAKSIRNYQDVLGRFSRSVGPSVSVKSVAQSDVERFLATPGWSNATIRNYHRHLRTFFNWAVS